MFKNLKIRDMKRIFYIIIGLLSFTSCKGFLDVVPTGIVIPQSVTDYDMMLNGFNDGNSLVLYMDPEVWSDNESREYFWPEDRYREDEQDGFYNQMYANIHKCNIILENIDNAVLGTSTESVRTLAKRDAIAERASHYWLLVNHYAPAYNPATAATDLTVPLVLTTNMEETYTNATVEQLYDFIESELKTAHEMLDDAISKNNMRPSRPAIAGLLSKLYMYKGDASTALTYANESLTKYDFVYDYNTFTDRSEVSQGLSRPYGVSDMENLWHKGCKPGGYLFILGYTPELLALYDLQNDRRYEFFQQITNTMPAPYVEYDFDLKETNYLVSTPEMLLVRAECYAKTDDLVKAIADVNTLRRNRIKNHTDLPTPTSKDEALRIISEERRRELCFSGLYLFDLKRYHVEGRSIPTFKRVNSSGEEFTLAPGDKGYYISIPLYIRNLNPNIKDNK